MLHMRSQDNLCALVPLVGSGEQTEFVSSRARYHLAGLILLFHYHVLIMYNNGVYAISCMYIMSCHSHSHPLTISCPLPSPSDLLFPTSPLYSPVSVCMPVPV